MKHVVVIGAGHNGLVCANYLADAGFKVTVVERSERIGGATLTEEIIPGFRVSAASYSLSLFRPDIWRTLGLDEVVDVIPKQPSSFTPYPDGRGLYIWRETARAVEEIAKISRRDADAYPSWCAFWDETAPKLRLLIDDPTTTKASARQILGDALYRLCVEGSASNFAAHFFESDEIMGLIASQGIVGTTLSVDDPRTAWILSYHALGGEVVGSTGSWGYVRGGMGSISQALAQRAQSRGAQIITSCSVSKILSSGITTAEGTNIEADIIVSSAHPQTTNRLAGLPQTRWDSKGGVVKVNLALGTLPHFTADVHHQACNGTISITYGLEHLRQAHAESATNFSTTPWMEAFIASTVDATLVDNPDGHTLSAFCQYAPTRDFNIQTAERIVIDTLDSHAPGLRASILGSQVFGPRELEDKFGLVGGNIFHGELTQIFEERFPIESVRPNLFMCGSGIHPGGAVTGAPGRNAANRICQLHAE